MFFFPKLRKFLVRLLIALASLGVFIPIAVMFLLSGALAFSEGNPFFPPEMNAARVPPGEFVIGDLGGMPVKIPRYFASYVEYDGDPGFWEKRPGSPPSRTFKSRLSSFGLTFRFPDGAGLSTPDLIADFKKYGDPFWVDYYDPIKSITPWLNLGIWSGNRYPGDGFLDRLSQGELDFRAKNFGLPESSRVHGVTQLPDQEFGLTVYAPPGFDEKNNRPFRQHEDAKDLFVHRDANNKVDVYIECHNKNMPNLKYCPCTQYISLEPEAKIGIYVDYPRHWLPKWLEIKNLTSKLILSLNTSPTKLIKDTKITPLQN